MLRVCLPVVAFLTLVLSGSARAESWEERMWRQVHKKVSFELVDTKLSEACAMLVSLTGLNIILATEVRKTDPSLTLRVQDMDAGTALKWFTQLTDTYADVVDQAIYITDKPPDEKIAEEEKEDLMRLGAAHGIVIEMPPANIPLRDDERIKIALQIIEREDMKIQDFPGPDIGIGTPENAGAKFGGK
ncbi:MAG: hypothetical protein ABSE73_22340 [Planctomycetota bacterium]